MFDHIVRVRASFKKQQELLKEAGGDPHAGGRKNSKKRGPNDPEPEHIRFEKWQKKMWERVR